MSYHNEGGITINSLLSFFFVCQMYRRLGTFDYSRMPNIFKCNNDGEGKEARARQNDETVNKNKNRSNFCNLNTLFTGRFTDQVSLKRLWVEWAEKERVLSSFRSTCRRICGKRRTGRYRHRYSNPGGSLFKYTTPGVWRDQKQYLDRGLLKKKDTRIRNTANLQVKRTGRRDIRGHCGFSPAMPFIHVHNRGTSILHGPAHGDLHRQFVFLPYTAPNGRESAGTGRRVWLRRTMYRDVHTP